MTSENNERQKIAQVWRAGRLLAGKTQAQLSLAIGIPQSSISKYETQNLEPSASDWFRFCQYVGIDAHKTLNLGYIDGKQKFKDKLYTESIFNLPMKYRRDFSIKIRELIPFKESILTNWGEESWQEFLSIHKIENEMFSVYDFQVSIELYRDLIKWSEERNMDLISSAATCSGELVYHGLLQENMAVKTDARQFLKKLVENQPFYQNVIKTELLAETKHLEVILKFQPYILNFFDAVALKKFREYKTKSFSQIMMNHVPDFSGFKMSLKADEVSLMARMY